MKWRQLSWSWHTTMAWQNTPRATAMLRSILAEYTQTLHLIVSDRSTVVDQLLDCVSLLLLLSYTFLVFPDCCRHEWCLQDCRGCEVLRREDYTWGWSSARSQHQDYCLSRSWWVEIGMCLSMCSWLTPRSCRICPLTLIKICYLILRNFHAYNYMLLNSFWCKMEFKVKNIALITEYCEKHNFWWEVRITMRQCMIHIS